MTLEHSSGSGIKTRLSNLTLRQRLLLLLALMLTTSVIVKTALAFWHASGKVQVEVHAALVVGEQIVQDAVRDLKNVANPYQTLPSLIERFSGGRHLRVALLDMSGQEVVSSRLAVPDDPPPEWVYAIMGGERETAMVPFPPTVVGYKGVFIEADPRNEIQEFWEELSHGIDVLIVLAAVELGVIFWMLGWELRPLSDLRLAFSQIASGNFSYRLSDAASSDLTVVNHGFNEMAQRLEESEEAKTRLQEQLAGAQEEERADLARDLHDELGPLLFSVSLDAAELQRALGSDASTGAKERLEHIREAIKLAQKNVLDILGRLRTGTVEDLGLGEAIGRVIEFWKARHPHISFNVSVPEAGVGVPLDSVVYRVVQESLSNAVRHGAPTEIVIDVSDRKIEGVDVTVTDDGGGLRSPKVGNGITGMRERVSSQDGVLTVSNRDDGLGTIVKAHFPRSARVELREHTDGQLMEVGS